MAFDSFLKFTGGRTAIVGETQDKTYKGCMEVSEFSFGAETTLNITSATGGAGAGKATFKEFKIKKQTDSSSALLLQCLGTGDHYSKVQLYCRKSGTKGGASGKAYLVFAFGMVAVKSIDWAGASGDDVPTEDVVFEFGELFVAYYAQDASGNLGKPLTGAWSKINNTTQPGMINAGDTTN